MRRIPAAMVAIAIAGCGARTAVELELPIDAGPSCTPSGDETCNRADDDCDGAIDEGLGFGPIGEPIAIRIDEGETGECTSCRWAWGTALHPTPEGFVAIWRIGFDGSRPMPNAFSRALDREGRPVAPVRVLFDAPVPQGFRVVPSTRGRALLAFCLRVVADDVPASAFLDARGAVLAGPTTRMPHLRGCGGQLVGAAWTGRRHLFTWLHSGEGIALDVADEEGRTLRTEVYDRPGWMWIDGGAVLSVAHGGVLQVLLHRPDPDHPPTNQLIARRLDPEGVPLSEVVIPLPEGQAAEPLVAPAPRGWLILARRNGDTGYYGVRVDDGGGLISGPTLRDAERTHHDTHADLEPRPGGGFYYAATVYTGVPFVFRTILATLDDEGAIESAIESEPFEGDSMGDDWILSPDLVVQGGEVWMLHHGLAPDADANRVVLRRYGCLAE